MLLDGRINQANFCKEVPHQTFEQLILGFYHVGVRVSDTKAKDLLAAFDHFIVKLRVVRIDLKTVWEANYEVRIQSFSVWMIPVRV